MLPPRSPQIAVIYRELESEARAAFRDEGARPILTRSAVGQATTMSSLVPRPASQSASGRVNARMPRKPGSLPLPYVSLVSSS